MVLPSAPRWVGTGWTIFNNKGKPVKQYEPFFDDTHAFRFGQQVGVSATLFYDPVERVVATLHPNHTWGKVVFDPWRQETWDVNDTVLVADPKTDADVGDFFRRLPDADYLPTWYAQRQSGTLGTQEQEAASKAAVHANTPTVAYADSLGRTFLTIAHNKFEREKPDGTIETVEEKYQTRVILDIEGNQREVIDAKDRVVMRYDYDIAGPEKDEDTANNRIHQASMEAGERWMLNDVAGKPLYAWDSRDHQFRTTYDQLRRPVETSLREGAGSERLIGRRLYGETRPNPEAKNLRGKVVQLFDQAGVVTSDDYDFKGNLLRSSRQLAQEYKNTLDWSFNPGLSPEIFTGSTAYDALNRPTSAISPDGSVYRPTFNEANLLEKVDVNLRGAAVATPFVTDIDYNAKGQRELIAYANGTRTAYEYHRLTFRLTKLRTTRAVGLNGLASQLFSNPAVVQDLCYTFDPAGNITRIEDAALKTIFHNGQQVEPVCDYTYDAIYRLIEAKGREHIGQTAHEFNPQNRRDYDFVGLADFIAHPNDVQTMRRYTEQYEYDAAGNFQFIRHVANAGNWTRGYEYNEASLIEPSKQSNRLTKTTIGNGATLAETYTYTDALGNDVHGCMTAINSMKTFWDFNDQLQQVDLGGGGVAYYIYDAAGQRVRKVIERQNGTRKNERFYFGGVEVYREYDGNGNNLTLERETLHVMDEKQRIALVETKTIDDASSVPNPGPLIRYQSGNHLGSASLELDDAGQIISSEEYHPYGSTSYQAGRSVTEVSLKRYRYTGMERDEETGLSYHSARYYAPWLGRWLSCDPISLADLLNLYLYVRDNSITFNDPDGLSPSDNLSPAGKNQYSGVWGTLKRFWNKASVTVRALLLIPNQLDDVHHVEKYFPAEPLNKPVAVGSPPSDGPPPRPDPPGGSPAPKSPPSEPGHITEKKMGGESGARGRGSATKAAGPAMTAILVLGPGSAEEKAKALAVGYGIGKGSELVATRAVGVRLAALMGAVASVLITMPNDHGAAYNEAQARREAQQALLEELNGRAVAIYIRETGKGYVPDWNFAYKMAVDEKYVELGRDKVDAAQEKSLKEIFGDPNPNVCSKYGPPRSVFPLGSPSPIYNQPRMYAR